MWVKHSSRMLGQDSEEEDGPSQRLRTSSAAYILPKVTALTRSWETLSEHGRVGTPASDLLFNFYQKDS